MPVYQRVAEETYVTAMEVKKHPFLAICEKDECTYRTCADSVEDAEVQLAEHACPRKGTDNMTWGKSILEKAWDMLDQEVDQIMAVRDRGAEITEGMKANSRGKAEILALFMHPYFENADDISREAMRRYKSRLAGEECITPGVGAGRLILPEGARKEAIGKPVPSTIPDAQPAQPRRPAPPAAKKHKLTDEEVAIIKERLEGGFPVDMLAAAYEVTPAIIRSL